MTFWRKNCTGKNATKIQKIREAMRIVGAKVSSTTGRGAVVAQLGAELASLSPKLTFVQHERKLYNAMVCAKRQAAAQPPSQPPAQRARTESQQD